MSGPVPASVLCEPPCPGCVLCEPPCPGCVLCGRPCPGCVLVWAALPCPAPAHQPADQLASALRTVLVTSDQKRAGRKCALTGMIGRLIFGIPGRPHAAETRSRSPDLTRHRTLSHVFSLSAFDPRNVHRPLILFRRCRQKTRPTQPAPRLSRPSRCLRPARPMYWPRLAVSAGGNISPRRSDSQTAVCSWM